MQTIKLAIFRAKISEVVSDAHRPACRLCDKLARLELAPVLVDLLAQPGLPISVVGRNERPKRSNKFDRPTTMANVTQWGKTKWKMSVQKLKAAICAIPKIRRRYTSAHKLSASICAISKNEGRYILEWVAFHKAIGVSHIFLYDNESTDNSVELLKPFIIEGFLTVIHWPSECASSSQLSAYRHFTNFLAKNSEWIIFLDIDEFINLKKHDYIEAFLTDYGDVSGVAINWRMFGDNGEVSYRQGLLMDRFSKASRTEFGPNQHVKTFVRSSDMQTPDIHKPQIIDGKKTVTANREEVYPYPSCLSMTVNHDIAQINHYFVKSHEEWTTKRMRGRADLAQDRPDYVSPEEEFDGYNRNEEEDRSIQRFRQRLVAMLELVGVTGA